MPFEKGHEKTGGKEKGSKNKKTELWEEFSSYCLEGGLEKFKVELGKLDKAAYVKAFLTLLEFHKPKLARIVDKEGEDVIPSTITIEIVHSGPKIATSEKEADV
ncbi:MAG TPA: hypothetical protein VFF27_00125 [Bacteroidia bacterium]|jgi:hypothetical protein|nr:hypothetical protein [Bacteroidia bacterium]